MTVQTAYTLGQPVAVAGLLADAQENRVANYTAGGAIGFGRGVIQGATDGACLIAAASGVLIGVTALSPKGTDGATAVGYVATDATSVVESGSVWGHVVGAAAKNDPAYVIPTVGATQGQFTATPNALGSIGKFGSSGTDTLVIIDVTIAVKGETGAAGAPG